MSTKCLVMPLVFQETTMNSTLGRYVTVLETSMLRWVRHQVAQVSGMRSVVYLILSATWTGCMLVSHIGVGFLQISPDGKTIPYASGFRTPNGLGFDLEGNLFVTDNQGDWVGTSKMHHVEKGKFYGHAASLFWQEGWEGRPLSLSIEELDFTYSCGDPVSPRTDVEFTHSTSSRLF